MTMQKGDALIVLCCIFACSFLAQARVSADELQFNRDIRPILSENCFQCHGPDTNARQADLRLDVREDAVDAGAIVAGNPMDSEMWIRISSKDPDTIMPPPSSKKKLSDAERETVNRWISAGANYQPHWAFLSPVRSVVPQVKDSEWIRNEIDNFVLAKLEQLEMRPALEAGKERIIRRVTFDLTGLPPTLREIDAFLDDRNDDAYERLVDRLLRSEWIGERLASDWLDAARYSDTYGYQVDRDRHVWPWRDWVIRAFNRNLPYDQFLTEQLAGDLLPSASADQILATTYNRLHPQKVEGGSTPEEFRIEYVSDRTQTFATSMLGLTLECCRCHDHKFDPISQREYYQLTAFFDKIDEFGLYSYFTKSVPTPTLLMSNEQQRKEILTQAQSVAEAEQNDVVSSELFEQWLESGRGKILKDMDKLLVPGRIAHLDFEKVAAPNTAVDGVVGKAARLTGDDAIGVGVGNFHRSEPFTVTLWMETPDLKERAIVFHRSRAWTDAGSRGYQLLIEDGRLSFSLIHFWPGNAMRIRTKQALAVGEWQHVTVSHDGSSRAAGLRMWINGQRADCETIRDNLSKEIRGGGGNNIAIGERFRDRGFSGGSIDEFQVFSRQLSSIEVRQLHDGESLVQALEIPAAKLQNEVKGRLLEYFGLAVDTPSTNHRQHLQQLRQKSFDYTNAVQEIMVMREMSTPRQTYLLERGAYDARRDRVGPMTPSILPPYPANASRDRLGLARWLTTKDHPLTARIVVNRYWQLVMGEGIVRSPEDFGSQGQPPTHPQLLDWLAVDFVENGWDLKRLLKLIVMSASYRQDSIPSGNSRIRDPQNLYWSRASRHRYSAEMLRDNVLAVSGLLVKRIGGPPAKPYEVEASFKPTKKDSGDGLYRRSVYTYWKRTAPAPVMMALDAAKRDVCRVKRERTTSPLQVLILLNGPQFIEAARVLSERTLMEDSTLDGRLRLIFRRLTSRRPGQAELSVLRELWEKEQKHLQGNSEAIRDILGLANNVDANDKSKLDHATLTLVANALMNYDECIVRR
jgi:hypothetical protein